MIIAMIITMIITNRETPKDMCSNNGDDHDYDE